METISYKIAIDGNNENLRKVVADSQGRLEQLDDKHIKIAIDYDGNYSEFYKTIQNIYKDCPEVGIEFQYHMNKKALEQEMSKLQDLEISIKDPKTAYNNLLRETQSFIKDYNKAVEGKKKLEYKFARNSVDSDENPDVYNAINSKQWSQRRKTLMTLYNSLSDDFKANDDFNPVIDNLVNSFEESYTRFDGTIESLVSNQQKLVSEIQTNIDAIVQKAKEMGVELDSALGGNGNGSGNGNGTGDKIFTADLDTTKFDEGIAHVKSELDNLPSEKEIKVTVDASGTDELTKMVSGWSQAMDENGVFANEHYAVYNSKTGKLNGGYTYDKNEGVRVENFENLYQNLDPDTWIHSHPNLAAAFSDDDILNAFKKYQEGIVNQVVVAKNEVMSLCLDALDVPKFEKEVDLASKYDAIESEVSNALANRLKQDTTAVRNCVEELLLTSLDSGRVQKILAEYDKKELDTTNLETIINSAGENLTWAIDEFKQSFGKKINSALSDTLILLKKRTPEIEDGVNALGNENLHQSFQSMLLDVFSNPKYLKDGYSSAITVTPIKDYIKQNGAISDITSEAASIGIKLDETELDSDIARVRQKLDNLTSDRVIAIKLDSADIDPNAQAFNEETNVPTVNTSSANVQEAQNKIKTELEGEEYNITVHPVLRLTEAWNSSIEALSPQEVTVTPKLDVENKEEIQKQLQSALTDVDATKELKDSLSKSPLPVDVNLNNAEEFGRQIKQAVKSISPVSVSVKPTVSPASLKNLKKAIGSQTKEQTDAPSGYHKTHSGILLPNSTVVKHEEPEQKTETTTALTKEQIDSFKQNIETVTKGYKKLNDAVAKGNRTSVFEQQVAALSADLDELNKKQLDVISEEDIKNAQKLSDTLNDLLSQLNSADSKRGNMTKLASIKEQVLGTISKNSGMSSELRKSYDKVLADINAAFENETATSASDIQNILQKVKQLNGELKLSGRTTSFFDLTSERLGGLNAQLIAQYLSLQDFIRYIRIAAAEVIKLDTAMTELRKVSNASSSTLNKSFQRSAAVAKELGATISDVINMTADWSRLGYSVTDAEELARVTTLFKNVGDNMTADDASSYLISTMQGFQIEASNAIDIVDKYNEVANNFAISTEGIGAALQRSSAAFNAANTDLSEAIALVTTANTVAQDPESVGNAFKILSARIRGASNELKELGEDETEVVSSASLQKYVKGITGVDILEEDGKTFKSLYDILLGISKVWNDLSDLEQQGLVEKLAGKNRSNILLALLQNGEQLEDVYNTAINSSGSAMQEQSNYAQSIQYSIDRTKASLQELAATTLDGSDIKNAVELFNSLVQTVNKAVDAFGILVPLVTTVSAAFNFKKVSSDGSILTGIGEALDGVSYLTNGKKYKSLISSKESEIKTAQENIENGVNVRKEKKKLKELNLELDDLKTESEAAGKPLAALKGILGTIVAEAAVKFFCSLATAESRLQKSAYEATQAISEQNKAFDGYIAQIKEQYAVLENTSSTYEQQREARQALYDIQGQLISTYGDEANSVNILADEYNNLSSALKSVEDLKDSQLDKVWEQYGKLNTSSGFFDMLSDGFLNLFGDYENNAERLYQKYQAYTLDAPVKISGNSDSIKQYNEQAQAILERNNIIARINATNGKTTYTGNAEDVKNALSELQKLANNLDLTNVTGQIATAYAETSSMVSQAQAFVNELTRVREFENNNAQQEVLDDYAKLASRYEQAIVNGDEDALALLQEDALSLINSDAYTNLSDDAKRYIASLYPQLKSQIEAWEFEITFKDNLDGITEHAKAFSNTDELRNALENKTPEAELTDSQKQAKTFFQDNGYDVNQLVNQIETNDILPTKTAQDFEAKIASLSGDTTKLKKLIRSFGDEEKAVFLDVTKNCRTADQAVKAYNSSLNNTKKTLSAGDWATKLADLDSGFKDLQTLFNDVKDGGQFDYSGLVSAAENLSIDGKTTTQFDALKDAIATAPDDIGKCQSAFNDLVAAFIQAKVATQDLSAENEAAIAAYLEQQGVTNASAVAHRLVAQALAEEYSNSLSVVDGTDAVNAVMALSEKAAELEAQGLKDDAAAYKAYAVDKLNASITLMTSAQIEQLMKEVEGLGIATKAWQNYYAAKAAMEAASSAKVGDWVGDSESGYRISSTADLQQYRSEQNKLLSGVEKQLKAEAEKQQNELLNNKAVYSAPVSGSGGGGGGDNSSKDNTTDIDQTWDDRAIAQAEKAYQKFLDARDDESKSYSERLGTYEEANRKQWKESYEAYVKYAMQYRNAINGNLDITEYTPTWSSEDGRYKTDLGELTSVVSNGDKTFTIQIATKLSDGTELTPEQAQEYLKSLSTNSSDDLLKSDTKNILIRYTEGNDPSAFVYEQGQDQIKNLQYLRDLSYGAYKEQKDQIDSLGEALDALINKLKEQKTLYENVVEQNTQEVKRLFGEEQGNAFIELIKNGSIDLADWHTIIKGASDEQKEALENLRDNYDKLQEVIESVEDREKEAHENRMKQFEMELEELEAIQGMYEAQQSIYESQISLKEATGKLITTADYIKLLNNSEKITESYEKQLSVLREQLGEVKPMSTEYYNVQSKILDVENGLIQVKEQQAEWNEEIKNIPINLLDQYLERLKAIQNLVSDYMSLQTTYGKANTADEYGEIFKIANDNIDYALEQQKKLKEKLANYEWGSDKYNETASSIESINSDLSSILEQMVEWNKAILNIPLDKLNEVNEQLNLVISAMSDIESEYDQVITAVTDSISKQIDDLEKEQEAYDDNIQDRIDGIQELIDALERENEARQKLLDLENAEYDLEKARTQKNIATIQDGRLTYTADEDAIREQQAALDEAEYNYRIYQLQQQIEQLEKEKEDKDQAYQDEIDNLQKIADKWSEITSNIELAKNQLKATEYLGDGWLNKVLTGDDAEIYEQFKTLYETMDKDLTQYQEQVASNERIATLMEQFITQYENGSITYEQALNGLNSLVSALTTGLDVNGTLSSYKELFTGTNVSSLSDVLSKLQNSAQTEANNLANYMSIYKSNEEVISKYTSTWEELKKSVDEQIKALKKAYEAALAAATAMRYYSSSSGGSGGGGGGSEYTTNIAIAGRNYSVNSSTGAVTYFNGKSAGYSVSVSGGRYTGSSSSSTTHVIGPSGNYIRHDGIELGAVEGTTDDKKVAILKAMSLKPMKADEIPQLLQKGEVVLNTSQQSQLLKNMGALTHMPTAVNHGTNVVLNMSDLTFNEINNGQDFANFITKNLSNAVSQAMAK